MDGKSVTNHSGKVSPNLNKSIYQLYIVHMTSEHQALPLRIGVMIIFKNDGLYKLISLDKFQNESMSQESFQESQAFTSSKLCWR